MGGRFAKPGAYPELETKRAWFMDKSTLSATAFVDPEENEFLPEESEVLREELEAFPEQFEILPESF